MIKNKVILSFVIVALALLTGVVSCEEAEYVDCTYCYQIKPDFGDLLIDVTVNDENKLVPVTVYHGETVNGDTVWFGYTDTLTCDVELGLDRTYTVTAEYKVGDKTVIAVDTDKLELNYTEYDCDEACYYITGGKINVKLRHDQ